MERNDSVEGLPNILSAELDESGGHNLSLVAERGDMSRGAMTAWICATLLILGLVGLYYVTRMHPLERNAECQTMFSMDQECVWKNASARLRGTYRNPNF